MSNTLPPVPGPNITDKSFNLLAPWRSWFSQLYTYVTQHIGSTATAQNPTLTGVLSLNGTQISTGAGSPNGKVVGNPGDLYLNTNGGLATLWVKENGAGASSGWVDGAWYGSFYDTTTQTAASATTAYPITLNSTSLSNGVYIGTVTSQVYVNFAGNYNIQFSAQLESTNAALQDVQIWIRQNGTDVPASNSIVSVPNSHGGVNGHTIVAWNWVLSMKPNDYFEIIWQSSSNTVTIKNYPAGVTPVTPVVPSMIVTVTQI